MFSACLLNCNQKLIAYRVFYSNGAVFARKEPLNGLFIINNKNATLLAITENGFGKRTELDEYRVQNRGGRGVITYKVTPKTGNIVGIRIATGDEDVMLITDTGTIIRLKVIDKEEILMLPKGQSIIKILNKIHVM